MKAFLVGGFVRDKLLGLSPNDRDYVVVGETPTTMIEKGFIQVGGHFPVFLHPETKEEYALARQEASTGNGYGDFTYNWDGVTLEEDLGRRDITINAMAIDADGAVVDLFGGMNDLKAGVLRHTSEAFAEDPLRVLRVARFAARYDFDLASETLLLMKEMTAKGMLLELPGERVWKETEKALLTPQPSKYFKILKDCGALAVWFPELDAMADIPQRPDYHAEGNVWIHTLMVLDEAAKLTNDLEHDRCLRVRLAALTHDFGKTVTPKELLWGEDGELIGRHHGHEDPDRFGPLLTEFADRLTLPSRLRKFAWVVSAVHQNIHNVKQLSTGGLVRLFDRVGGARPITGDQFYLEDIGHACMADNLGRLVTKEDGSVVKPTEYPQGAYFKTAMEIINSVDVGAIVRPLLLKKVLIEEALGHVKGVRRKALKSFVSKNN